MNLARLLVLVTALAQVPMSTLDANTSTWILSGWVSARSLSASGGDQTEVLNIVKRALDEIERWRAQAARGATPRDAASELELRYADTAIRAAVDAAQDERDEMSLYLSHARDLSRQLELMGAAARWPLPIDEMAGELWFEVDRYAESRDAYAHAVEASNSPRAWMGLARAQVKLGDAASACAAYRRALQTALMEDWQTEADTYVKSAACQAQ